MNVLADLSSTGSAIPKPANPSSGCDLDVVRPNLDIETSRDLTFVDFISISGVLGLLILMGLCIVLLGNSAKRSATLALRDVTANPAENTAAAVAESAAAPVSPLSITSGKPVDHAAPAALPPLIGNGDSVSVNLAATATSVEIASGVQYQAWTFGGTVPGPILHLRQGQTVSVTFVNNANMTHSIDFHAAQIDPAVAYRSVNPHEKVEFSFVARTPGAFIYHCGTPPVLQHIANGMYGAIIVDPAQPLPPADVSYVLVQGEWYAQRVSGTLMSGDYQKMLNVTPGEVVFNGVAFQYNDHPLTAQVGQRVRLYVVNAGPNLSSAFHIIGGMFAAVYPDGDSNHALAGVSTYLIAPGQGVVFDTIMQQPGKYPIVDHSMRDMMLGAAGMLNVTDGAKEIQ